MAYYRTAKAKAKTSQVEAVQVLTEDVFAAACAAQRINGEYVKECYAKYNDMTGDLVERVTANKLLVRELLAGRKNEITDTDREEAVAVRSYWHLKLFAVLCGNANSYVISAVDAASTDTIAANDFMRMGIISSLPAAYDRGIVRDKIDDIKQEVALVSKHFGRIGEKVQGTLEVIDCIYSQNWNCYYVTGKFDGNMVRFSYKNAVDCGKEFKISAKVKDHKAANLTQLNYVKMEK